MYRIWYVHTIYLFFHGRQKLQSSTLLQFMLPCASVLHLNVYNAQYTCTILERLHGADVGRRARSRADSAAAFALPWNRAKQTQYRKYYFCCHYIEPLFDLESERKRSVLLIILLLRFIFRTVKRRKTWLETKK